MKANLLKTLGAAGVLAISLIARGGIIYDNTSTDSGFFLGATNGQQIGDQITMGSSSALFVTNFSFEYYSPNSVFSGTVQADVSFYYNTAPNISGYLAPGATPFFDTGFFGISAPNSIFPGTNSAILSFDLPNVLVPTNFTFVVSFTGLAGGDIVGVELFNPITVGQNTPDYWYLNNGGTWTLMTNNATPVNFGAQITGTVPEPGVISLSILGGAALLAAVRRRRS